MKFLLLIYDQEKRWTALGEADRNADYQEFAAFGKEFADAIRGGDALQPTADAKTIRVRSGKPLVSDGPFAETKEQMAGYYLVEAKDIDAALAIAAKIPWARFGSIEVRPVMQFS